MGLCYSVYSNYHNVSTEAIHDDEILQPPSSHYPSSSDSDSSINIVRVRDIPSNSLFAAPKNKWHLRLRFLKKT